MESGAAGQVETRPCQATHGSREGKASDRNIFNETFRTGLPTRQLATPQSSSLLLSIVPLDLNRYTPTECLAISALKVPLGLSSPTLLPHSAGCPSSTPSAYPTFVALNRLVLFANTSPALPSNTAAASVSFMRCAQRSNTSHVCASSGGA